MLLTYIHRICKNHSAEHEKSSKTLNLVPTRNLQTHKQGLIGTIFLQHKFKKSFSYKSLNVYLIKVYISSYTGLFNWSALRLTCSSKSDGALRVRECGVYKYKVIIFWVGILNVDTFQCSFLVKSWSPKL